MAQWDRGTSRGTASGWRPLSQPRAARNAHRSPPASVSPACDISLAGSRAGDGTANTAGARLCRRSLARPREPLPTRAPWAPRAAAPSAETPPPPAPSPAPRTAPAPAPRTASRSRVGEGRGVPPRRPLAIAPLSQSTGTDAPAEVSAIREDTATPRGSRHAKRASPQLAPPGSRPHARVPASPVGAARRSRVLCETLRRFLGTRCGASPWVDLVPTHSSGAPRSSVEFPHARSGTARPGRGRVKRRDRRRGAERGRPGIRRGAGQGSAPPGAAGRAEPSPPVPCPGAAAAAPPPGGAAGGKGRAPPPTPAPAMSRRAAGSA